MCQYTFLAAIKYSNSATATVLQSLNVVLMAIVMAVWNRKRMSRIQIAATILSALVLGTRFTVVELIGFVLVVGTVFLSVSTKE
ncbi:EamA family transporter [Blautia obeum]|uniref:EamA family transporter n=1 Tax=Blautia obeum TaxID=40520 RepID=UPI001D083072|nr:EamA family transporter [Blautia obeum]MCB6332184.1 EamA family transporter [Blautia obeum]MCQ5357142.1 EamA family transporter [Blautia obeum]